MSTDMNLGYKICWKCRYYWGIEKFWENCLWFSFFWPFSQLGYRLKPNSVFIHRIDFLSPKHLLQWLSLTVGIMNNSSQHLGSACAQHSTVTLLVWPRPTFPPALWGCHCLHPCFINGEPESWRIKSLEQDQLVNEVSGGEFGSDWQAITAERVQSQFLPGALGSWPYSVRSA